MPSEPAVMARARIGGRRGKEHGKRAPFVEEGFALRDQL
jgi:hypothetical protein